ncbi:hypothetical protein GB937_000263 [Aspergillus fischeri]|nr:hypothetical protein GB937_000263 [Aspergillus fischeri]
MPALQATLRCIPMNLPTQILLLGPLTVEDAPLKLPGTKELLIQVEACGLCSSDIYSVYTFPVVPGHEIIGKIAVVRTLGKMKQVISCMMKSISGILPGLCAAPALYAAQLIISAGPAARMSPGKPAQHLRPK